VTEPRSGSLGWPNQTQVLGVLVGPLTQVCLRVVLSPLLTEFKGDQTILRLWDSLVIHSSPESGSGRTTLNQQNFFIFYFSFFFVSLHGSQG
jgi:hypothetical protein